MARDRIHEAVKQSLIKDGWKVLDDPFYIEFEDAKVAADLRLERAIHLSRDNERIVVEIKSFLGRSFMNDLHGALGQYQTYAFFLKLSELSDKIYLAVPASTYSKRFSGATIQKLMSHYQVRLIVVDIQEEEITQWIQTD